MAGYKAAVTRKARQAGLITSGQMIWQRGYYEHVVRSEQDLARIAAYIDDNPRRWFEDGENPSRRSGSPDL